MSGLTISGESTPQPSQQPESQHTESLHRGRAFRLLTPELETGFSGLHPKDLTTIVLAALGFAVALAGVACLVASSFVAAPALPFVASILAGASIGLSACSLYSRFGMSYLDFEAMTGTGLFA